MKTYVADPKIARKWYLKKRKTYKTYKIGMAVMWGALCLIFILDLSFLLRAEGIEQLGEILLLCIGADILPGIAAVLGYVLIKAGGLEFLMRRPSEKCIFDKESFTLEYIPEPGSQEREPRNYNLIRHRILYRDIQSVDYEEELGRITIHGTHTILKYYQTKDSKKYADTQTTTLPFSVFCRYPDFDELKDELMALEQANLPGLLPPEHPLHIKNARIQGLPSAPSCLR